MLLAATIADASSAPCSLPYNVIVFNNSVAIDLRLKFGWTLTPSNQTFLLLGQRDA
jgi:hypothetical protein